MKGLILFLITLVVSILIFWLSCDHANAKTMFVPGAVIILLSALISATIGCNAGEGNATKTLVDGYYKTLCKTDISEGINITLAIVRNEKSRDIICWETKNDKLPDKFSKIGKEVKETIET